MLKSLGSDYGGWTIDLDQIPDNSTVIDAGVGEDISFARELLKYKNVDIVFVDPTQKAYDYFVKEQEGGTYIKSALMPQNFSTVNMYINNIPGHVSESVDITHRSVSRYQSYCIDTISPISLRVLYDNISLIKMDIEGAEYSDGLFEECIGIPQIALEFHHFCLADKTKGDTESLIQMLTDAGYTIVYSNDKGTKFTFLKK